VRVFRIDRDLIEILSRFFTIELHAAIRSIYHLTFSLDIGHVYEL